MITLASAFQEFCDYKLTYIKEKSVKNYRETLHLFIDKIGADKSIDALTQDDIQKYLISVNQSNTIKGGTKNCYIRNLRIFISWLISEYGLTSISSKKIRVPRMPKKNPYFYSDSNIKLMFDMCKCKTEWITFRNQLILTLLLDTGVRLNEIRLIKKSDIDMENKQIKIFGKGSKERTVPFSNRTFNLLNKHWNTCPYKSCAYALCGRFGGQLGVCAVTQFIYKLDKSVNFKVNAHSLRHFFATDYALHYLEQYGVSCSRELAIMMGHEDTKTTDRYIHDAEKILALKRRYSHMDMIDW